MFSRKTWGDFCKKMKIFLVTFALLVFNINYCNSAKDFKEFLLKYPVSLLLSGSPGKRTPRSNEWRHLNSTLIFFLWQPQGFEDGAENNLDYGRPIAFLRHSIKLVLIKDPLREEKSQLNPMTSRLSKLGVGVLSRGEETNFLRRMFENFQRKNPIHRNLKRLKELHWLEIELKCYKSD